MIICAVFRRQMVRHREREKSSRLEAAEREMRALRARADRVERSLIDRQRRNHWQESIDRLIQGGKA